LPANRAARGVAGHLLFGGLRRVVEGVEVVGGVLVVEGLGVGVAAQGGGRVVVARGGLGL
jgi:hypothetical protein